MSIDDPIARDAVIRQAAFNHVRSLQAHDPILSHEAIRQGFVFDGQRWPLWNPQRGIFKPRGMPFLLSIRTVVPRQGARIWYDDQRRVHRRSFAGDDELDYAFMGTDPAAPDSVWLRQAADWRCGEHRLGGSAAGSEKYVRGQRASLRQRGRCGQSLRSPIRPLKPRNSAFLGIRLLTSSRHRTCEMPL